MKNNQDSIISVSLADTPVERVMTREVLWIDIAEPASEFLRLLAQHPIHHVPVLSVRKVVGMLSSADVMKLDIFLPKNGIAANEYLDQHITVAALMHKPAITVQRHQSLVIAARLMASHGCHSLPVVDDFEQLLGIITTTDIMKFALQGGRQPDASSPADGSAQSREIRLSNREFDQAVAVAMTAVDSGRDPYSAAKALLYAQRRLIVLDGVVQKASRYLNCGQDVSQHTALLKAITDSKSTTSNGGGDTAELLLASG